MIIISSMLIAMLSALFGVFFAREKLMVPYKVRTAYLFILLDALYYFKLNMCCLGLTQSIMASNHTSLFSVSAGQSQTRLRSTAHTTIYVFCRIEAAASGMVGALALTFFAAVTTILLFVWAAHDMATSIAVTAFSGLMIIGIFFSKDQYIVLPRSVVPGAPPDSITNVVYNVKSPTITASQSIKVDFFSDIAKPALHNIDNTSSETGNVSAGVTLGPVR